MGTSSSYWRPDPHSFLFIPHEVGAVSSTAVCAKIQRINAAKTFEEKQIAAQLLIAQGFLDRQGYQNKI